MISSSTAEEPTWSAYRLSKLGVNGITKGLAQELIKHNIVVNGIAPGSTATKLLNYKDGTSIYTNQNSIHRMTMPEEVAYYAKLLVSSFGETFVGETILMSGGRGVFDIR